MADKNKPLVYTVIVLVGFVAFIAGLFFSQHWHAPKTIDKTQFEGTLLDKPRPVQPFQLTGVDQQPFTNANLKGQWTLLFFGFTQCGSICPVTMAELGKMYRFLDEKKVKPLPQVVMITVDPKRDSLEKLKNYVHAFDVHFYGARGNQDVIDAMTREMGIAYAKIASTKNGVSQNYTIEHTGTIIVLNPRGELTAFFTMPHQAATLAHDYMLLIPSN